MYLIQITSNSSDYLNSMFKVHKGIPNEFVRQLIGATNDIIWLLKLL